jgi:pyrimidine operon attenuation protein/uracil phosphoribosyltransferase
MESRETILTASEIEGALERICGQVLERHPQLQGVVLVGVRTGGVFLADRLRRKVFERKGVDLPTGIIDVTLYRDDWTRLTQTPEVRRTEVGFSIEDRIVLIVDDVLFTGRTIRAAMDALLDLGRPRRVELAVLVDRGHRELPICPDYVGKALPTSRADSINVELVELAGRDQVVIDHGRYPEA